MVFFELVGSILVFVALIAIGIWECAKAEFLWMFVPENWVILLDRGKGNPYRVVGLHRGKGLLSRWGIYWMGFSTVEVHKFFLQHERENIDLGPDSTSDHWMIKDPTAVETDHLLNNVIHWIKVPGVVFDGGQRADILFKYEAFIFGKGRSEKDAKKGARTAVYIREGKFFEAITSIANSSAISDEILRKMTYDQFRNANKDEGSDLCVEIEKTINQTAGETSGYKLKRGSLAVVRFAASSTAETKLARLKMQAKIEKAAAILKAQGQVADITEAVKTIMKQLPDADHTTVVEIVGRIAVADRLANSKHLQAVGGAMLGIPSEENTGGKKRGKR